MAPPSDDDLARASELIEPAARGSIAWWLAWRSADSARDDARHARLRSRRTGWRGCGGPTRLCGGLSEETGFEQQVWQFPVVLIPLGDGDAPGFRGAAADPFGGWHDGASRCRCRRSFCERMAQNC